MSLLDKPFKESWIGKVLKLGGGLLTSTTGGKESGLVSIFKAGKDSASSKRVFKLFGGGSLIATGITMITTAFNHTDVAGALCTSSDTQAWIGLGLCALGVFTGWAMKSKDKAE